MAKIKENLVYCDYCNRVVMYQDSYPCTKPEHVSEVRDDYHICESCLAREFEHDEEETNEKEGYLY